MNNWIVQPMTNPEEARRKKWYRYTESGLDNVWLENGVERHETSYGPGISIEDLDGLDAAIANWIVARKSHWSGPEIRFLRKRMELSRKGLADLLGYSDRQVRRWEAEKAVIPAPASRLLRLLVREREEKADTSAPDFVRDLRERAVESEGIRAAVRFA